ncbi:hypothetical protein DPMN_165678 [Dreissena polymorpha]|uniref:SHSP domain-containing protein n=1 Tax=Dreissena polymorpha TaxID=45954 RepID=A0A9D4IWV0_DREPO|nr:hypothetical protein DPMN_165678 [Dreissena polymorpha]
MGLFSRPLIVTMPVGHPYHGTSAQTSMLDHLVADLFDGIVNSPMCRRSQNCGMVGPEHAATLFFPDTVKRKRFPWVHKLDFTGFHPKDISVKIDGVMLSVSAKREQRDGDNYDVIERVRRVKIPDDVDSKKLSCFMSPAGYFVVKGRYADKVCDTQCPEKCKAGQQRCCGKKEKCCKEDKIQTSKEKPCPETIETSVKNDGNPNNSEFPTEVEPVSLAECIVESPDQSLINSRCPSPAPSSADFVILDEDAHGKPDFEPVEQLHQTTTEEKTDQPVCDANNVVDIDGKKHFRVQLDMGSVPVENISIRARDGSLQVYATKKTEEDDGVRLDMEVRRDFRLPERADAGSARASIRDDGMLVVSVPLRDEQQTRDIPVEQ